VKVVLGCGFERASTKFFGDLTSISFNLGGFAFRSITCCFLFVCLGYQCVSRSFSFVCLFFFFFL
jgi:hypothetical protein